MPGGHHQISEPTLTTVFIGLLARFGPFWPCCGMFLLLFNDFGGIRLIRLSLFARVQVGECSQFNGLDEGQINSLHKELGYPFGLVVSFKEVSSTKKDENFFLPEPPSLPRIWDQLSRGPTQLWRRKLLSRRILLHLQGKTFSRSTNQQ